MNPEAVDSEVLDRYECRACGYIYEPDKGDDRRQIAACTPFKALPPDWRCPVCGSSQAQFQNIGPVGNPSGFKENLGYGLGGELSDPRAEKPFDFWGSGAGLSISDQPLWATVAFRPEPNSTILTHCLFFSST